MSAKPFDCLAHLRLHYELLTTPPAGCPDPGPIAVEVCCLDSDIDRTNRIVKSKYKKTISGYFNDFGKLAAEVKRVNKAPTYICVNPVIHDLLARCNNRLQIVENRTKDTELAAIWRNLLDIDPKRPVGISSTEEELNAALARCHAILGDFPELEAAAFHGISGNGAFLVPAFRHLDNSAENRALVTKLVDAIAARYSDNVVEIDRKAKNVARLMALGGTVKTKGEHLPGIRPWRYVSIESERREFVPIDLPEFLSQLAGPSKSIAVTAAPPAAAPAERAAPRTADQSELSGEGGGAWTPERRAIAALAKVEDAIQGDDGSTRTLKAATLVLQFLVNPLDTFRVLKEHFNPRCQPAWSDKDLWHKVEEAYKNNPEKVGAKLREGRPSANGGPPPRKGASAGGAGPSDHKPRVYCTDAELCTATAETLAALARINDPPSVFDLGGALGRVRSTTEDPPQAVAEPLGIDALRSLASEAAVFVEVRQAKRGCVEEAVFPPLAIPRSIAAMAAWPEDVAPPLESVVEFPTIRPDGRLLVEPGYHREARLYYAPTPDLVGLEVPSRPTPADVAAAKALILDEYLVDFLFDGQASRANAVALMLLPFVRALIRGATPFHLIEAAVEGTGKGKLANALAYPSLGHALPSTPQKEDAAEWRKALTTALKTRRSHIFFDNMYTPRDRSGCTVPIDSAPLALALTQPVWEDRLLGSNVQVRLAINCVFMGTGNNLDWSRELHRRLVTSRLMADQEDPSQRRGFFCHRDGSRSLEEWAERRRRELLRACLVLALFWVAEGRPDGDQVMGSYEQYSRVMGGILGCCGIEGFLANRTRPTSQDRESGRWHALVDLWHKRFGRSPISVAALFDAIEGQSPLYEQRKGGDGEWHVHEIAPEVPPAAELQTEFAEVFGDPKELVRRQKLGHLLRKQVDRVWAGHRIVRCTAVGAGGTALYRLADPHDDSKE
jgi:hypothetical protein